MLDSMMNVGWALLPDLSCADDGQECPSYANLKLANCFTAVASPNRTPDS